MKKHVIVLALCLLISVVCFFLYWWALAPIVSRFISREHCIYRGLEYYENDAYLEFENGEDFCKMLSTYRTGTDYDVTDFYYVDNYIEDNPLRGKMCDVYALDVKYSNTGFAAAMRKVLDNGTSKLIWSDFELYSIPYNPTLGELVYVIGVCEEVRIIRFIMITEFDDSDDFSGVLSLHANLEWDILEQKVGD